MKKFSEKMKNNKGFSLVELIVVVAIMAVLMAVLVPTLVRNVEKTRVQKDKSAIAEVRQAIITAMAQEQFQDAKASNNGATVSSGSFAIGDLFDGGLSGSGVSSQLAEEVVDTIGSETIALSSALRNGANIKVTTLNTRAGQCTIQVVPAASVDMDSFYIDVNGEHTGEAPTN